IPNERGQWLVDLRTISGQPAMQSTVVIPLAVKDRDEANPPLDHPPGQEARSRKLRRRTAASAEGPCAARGILLEDPILAQRLLGLRGEVDQLRSRGLHPKGQFVGGNPAGDLRIGVETVLPLVQLVDRL